MADHLPSLPGPVFAEHYATGICIFAYQSTLDNPCGGVRHHAGSGVRHGFCIGVVLRVVCMLLHTSERVASVRANVTEARTQLQRS